MSALPILLALEGKPPLHQDPQGVIRIDQSRVTPPNEVSTFA